MRLYPSSGLRWYHIILGILGLAVVVFVLLYLLLGRRRLSQLVEEEADVTKA